MSFLVEKLAANGQLSAEQVERIGRNVRAFVKEARSNPELMKAALEKLGGPADIPFKTRFLQNLAMTAGTTLTSGLIAGGMMYGMKGIESVKGGMDKTKHYKNMLDVNPDLQAKGVNAKVVMRHFDTLHKFNPEYASDPVVAGTYVNNAMEYARPSLEVVNNLVKARNDHLQGAGEKGDFAEMQKSVNSALTEGVKIYEQTAQEDLASREAARPDQRSEMDYLGAMQRRQQHETNQNITNPKTQTEINEAFDRLKAIRAAKGQ